MKNNMIEIECDVCDKKSYFQELDIDSVGITYEHSDGTFGFICDKCLDGEPFKIYMSKDGKRLCVVYEDSQLQAKINQMRKGGLIV